MSIGGVNADRIPKTNGLVMRDSVSQSHLKATYYDKHFLRQADAIVTFIGSQVKADILTILVGIFIGILFGSLPIAMFLRIITAQVLILILG